MRQANFLGRVDSGNYLGRSRQKVWADLCFTQPLDLAMIQVRMQRMVCQRYFDRSTPYQSLLTKPFLIR